MPQGESRDNFIPTDHERRVLLELLQSPQESLESIANEFKITLAALTIYLATDDAATLFAPGTQWVPGAEETPVGALARSQGLGQRALPRLLVTATHLAHGHAGPIPIVDIDASGSRLPHRAFGKDGVGRLLQGRVSNQFLAEEEAEVIGNMNAPHPPKMV